MFWFDTFSIDLKGPGEPTQGPDKRLGLVWVILYWVWVWVWLVLVFISFILVFNVPSERSPWTNNSILIMSFFMSNGSFDLDISASTQLPYILSNGPVWSARIFCHVIYRPIAVRVPALPKYEISVKEFSGSP